MLLTLSRAMAAGWMERMTGTITAMEPDAQTVVAVSQVKETLTVRGLLSPQAMVLKGKKTVP
jgi:hypothetical protein